MRNSLQLGVSFEQMLPLDFGCSTFMNVAELAGYTPVQWPSDDVMS